MYWNVPTIVPSAVIVIVSVAVSPTFSALSDMTTLENNILDPEKYVLGSAADLTVLQEAGIRDTSTVIITPHTAWATDRLAPRIAEVFAANLHAPREGAGWATRIA